MPYEEATEIMVTRYLLICCYARMNQPTISNIIVGSILAFIQSRDCGNVYKINL